MPSGPIPTVAQTDAIHIATATFYGCHYLVTWNFRRIANAKIRRAVDNILRVHRDEQVIICTVDELNPDQPEPEWNA
jgi:heterodisulfide reductase subunit B